MCLTTKDWLAAFAIIQTLEQHGFEAVVVGGAVRDYLLGRAVHDVDVATSASPKELKMIFPHTVDVGIEHGTILVLHELANIEVTTFRTDGMYVDHRRPKDVQFVRSLEEDLLRRDFTMNAMAMRKDGSVVDLYNGRQHLQDKLIQAVGHPQARFQEDALRMLRAIRFAAQLSFSIERQTLHAIRQQASDIQWIAYERIKAEFDKIWVSRDVYNGLHLLQQSTLSIYLKGDFCASFWRNFHAKDADIGWAFFVLQNRLVATDVMHVYRLSNKEKQFVRTVINAYDILLSTGWQLFDYFQLDERALVTAFHFAQYRGETVNGLSEVSIRRAKQQLVIQSKEQLAVSGLDFLEWSGRKRGPWLKEVLDAVLLAVLNKECENNRATIKEWYVHEFNNKG